MMEIRSMVALQAITVLKNLPVMPPKTMRMVSKTLAQLRQCPDVIALEELRMALVRKYGKENGNGQFVMDVAAADKFNADYLPEAQKVIEIDVTPISESLLDVMEREKIKIGAEDMEILECLLG